MSFTFTLQRKQDKKIHKIIRKSFDQIKDGIRDMGIQNPNSVILLLKQDKEASENINQLEVELQLLEMVGVEFPFLDGITLFHVWLYENTDEPDDYKLFRWGYCPIAGCFRQLNHNLCISKPSCVESVPRLGAISETILYRNPNPPIPDKEVNVMQLEEFLLYRTKNYNSPTPLFISKWDEFSFRVACHSVCNRGLSCIEEFIQREVELLFKRLIWAPDLYSLICKTIPLIITSVAKRVSCHTHENYTYNWYCSEFGDPSKPRTKKNKHVEYPEKDASVKWPGVDGLFNKASNPWLRSYLCKMQGYFHFHPVLWPSIIKLYYENYLRQFLIDFATNENTNKQAGDILRDRLIDENFIRSIKSTYVAPKRKLKIDYSLNAIKDTRILFMSQPMCMEKLYSKAFSLKNLDRLSHDEMLLFYKFAMQTGMKPEVLVAALKDKAELIQSHLGRSTYLKADIIPQIQSVEKNLDTYKPDGCMSLMRKGLCSYFVNKEAANANQKQVGRLIKIAHEECHKFMASRHKKEDDTQWRQGNGPLAVAMHQKEMLGL